MTAVEPRTFTCYWCERRFYSLASMVARRSHGCTTAAPRKPRLLDLFCGAGGAAVGYHRAGFDVVGVDIKPQPNYPFTFWEADALDSLATGTWREFDAIHASPPCQMFTTMSNRWRGNGGKTDVHVDLLTPTRALLADVPLPWVIENVPGSRGVMRPTLVLRGGMFGLGVDRPRYFESNVWLRTPELGIVANPIGVYGKAPDGRLLWKRADGTEQRAAASVEEGGAAMGIDWMAWDELKEAVPPAYTEWIGHQLMRAIAPASPGLLEPALPSGSSRPEGSESRVQEGFASMVQEEGVGG